MRGALGINLFAFAANAAVVACSDSTVEVAFFGLLAASSAACVVFTLDCMLDAAGWSA